MSDFISIRQGLGSRLVLYKLYNIFHEIRIFPVWNQDGQTDENSNSM